VATDATPEQVRKLFKRTIAVGMIFGVIEVFGSDLRKGLSQSAGRHLSL